MINLYPDEMAEIYDAMYQSFIDYDKEYAFYNNLLQKNEPKSILEIGSGTGNIAKRFIENHQNYRGLDFSTSMITIAQKRNPDCEFLHGDMRDFNLEKKADAIIITSRSTSYLITNNDINDTFNCLYNNLNPNGIIIFDFIDANRYIPFIKENKTVIHSARHKGHSYLRKSDWEISSHDNFILEWTAKYYKDKIDNTTIIANDYSTVRVFTLNEIQLFLYLHNFEIQEIIDRKTYAFDTFVIVAKKKS
ncbi:SAM-dependent methyltransferase [Flavobacterium sp. L1I52]|uniref:SAM-dependent methyltransferase n=1 Tax=Flavobacterium pokkalii TaxID=1940408 RepID=A0ABR7UPP3_9FLAO|nr:class I SAM-dependent methyltransferase [Flavobacterium pokkalii]MBD0724387.1 SAM-dependent methyltransferase [Flavobacterium pokkalii]